MSIGKIETRLAILDREKRAFFLDHSLHPSLYEMEANNAWGEGLVDDISEGLGHLAIFCPLSCDKMNSIANIGERKFGWMSTSGLLKLRMLFEAKSRDGGCINTSCRCNGVGRMAGIKPGEDVALLSRREGSYEDGG